MKELDIPMMNENCFAFFLSKEAEYRMYLCIHPKLTGVEIDHLITSVIAPPIVSECGKG